MGRRCLLTAEVSGSRRDPVPPASNMPFHLATWLTPARSDFDLFGSSLTWLGTHPMRHVGSWPRQEPIRVLQIPTNCPLERVRQLFARRPTQFGANLGRIHTVPQVIYRP